MWIKKIKLRLYNLHDVYYRATKISSTAVGRCQTRTILDLDARNKPKLSSVVYEARKHGGQVVIAQISVQWASLFSTVMFAKVISRALLRDGFPDSSHNLNNYTGVVIEHIILQGDTSVGMDTCIHI